METRLYKNLGKKIKSLRAKHKITQEDLAEITGIEYKYLQKIERENPPNITLKTLAKLAQALKTTPAKLLDSK